jgi:hypothetical protein
MYVHGLGRDDRLPFDEILVLGASSHKDVVTTNIGNLMIVHDDNLLGTFDGGKPMCNNQDGASHDSLFNRFLYQVLRLGVQRRRLFVEDQTSRIKIRGSMSKARAMAMRCLIAPHVRPPTSRTGRATRR